MDGISGSDITMNDGRGTRPPEGSFGRNVRKYRQRGRFQDIRPRARFASGGKCDASNRSQSPRAVLARLSRASTELFSQAFYSTCRIASGCAAERVACTVGDETRLAKRKNTLSDVRARASCTSRGDVIRRYCRRESDRNELDEGNGWESALQARREQTASPPTLGTLFLPYATTALRKPNVQIYATEHPS